MDKKSIFILMLNWCIDIYELSPDFKSPSDFELAIINSWQTTFPNALITGCYFHFSIYMVK